MSREKQIDEMCEVLRQNAESCKTCRWYEAGLCLGNCELAEDNQTVCEALYEAGYRKQEWISIEERLPERQGAYLIFTCDRRISMCHFIDHYCDGNMQFNDYRVTHWMPLPEAPKMKGGVQE